MRNAFLSACVLLAGLSSAASAQVKFDYITFDKIRLDPNYALQTSTWWGIIVNTGAVPISLDLDWERGLCYAESTQELGSFFYEPLNPYGNDYILQPGEAIGDADPLLLAKLLPGETFATNAFIASLQFGVPFPSSDFELDVFAQMGNQIAKTKTTVEVTSLGGAAFWEPVTAKRVSCELSPVKYRPYGAACPGPVGSAVLYPRGHNWGPGGPPWVAYRSSMPHLGNWAFGLQIESPVHNPNFLLGIDIAPGNYPLLGCNVLLGLTPNLTLIPGTIPHFEETVNVPIPNSPAWAGLSVYFQAYLIGGTFLATNGVEVILGDVTP